MEQESAPGDIDRSGGGRAITGLFSGLALGTVVGAALALLAAPKSGEELRGQLRDTGLQVSKRVGAVAGQARDQAGVLQGQAQGAFEQVKGRAKALTITTGDHVEIPLAGVPRAASDLPEGALPDTSAAANASMQAGES